MPEETKSRAEASAQSFTPNDPGIAAAIAAMTFTRAPDFKVYFTDFHRITSGNGTVNIVFSRTTHAPSLAVARNIVEEQCEVIMSWTQLKMVTENLVAAVAAIETEIGPIPFPPNFHVNDAANRAVIRGLGLSVTRDTP